MEENLNKEELELLKRITESAEEAKIIKEKERKKRQPKSEIPLYFDLDDEDEPFSLITLLIKSINDKKYSQQDLYDFCTKKCDGNVSDGRALANNAIERLKKRRDIRASTIELLCEFMNVDIILGTR